MSRLKELEEELKKAEKTLRRLCYAMYIEEVLALIILILMILRKM